MKDKLLDLVACPVCKGPLEFRSADAILVCRAERLAFPVRDGIPLLLDSEARQMSSAEVDAVQRPGR